MEGEHFRFDCGIGADLNSDPKIPHFGRNNDLRRVSMKWPITWVGFVAVVVVAAAAAEECLLLFLRFRVVVGLNDVGMSLRWEKPAKAEFNWVRYRSSSPRTDRKNRRRCNTTSTIESKVHSSEKKEIGFWKARLIGRKKSPFSWPSNVFFA